MDILRDFQSAAQHTRSAGIPLVVMVSSSDCRYCAQLKREVFNPIGLNADYDAIAVFGEVLLDDPAATVDFDGTSVTTREFADRYGASLTPTVLFLAPNGAEVAERIVGITNIEFYGWYLDQHIAAATASIASEVGQ